MNTSLNKIQVFFFCKHDRMILSNLYFGLDSFLNSGSKMHHFHLYLSAGAFDVIQQIGGACSELVTPGSGLRLSDTLE